MPTYIKKELTTPSHSSFHSVEKKEKKRREMKERIRKKERMEKREDVAGSGEASPERSPIFPCVFGKDKNRGRGRRIDRISRGIIREGGSRESRFRANWLGISGVIGVYGTFFALFSCWTSVQGHGHLARVLKHLGAEFIQLCLGHIYSSVGLRCMIAVIVLCR